MGYEKNPQFNLKLNYKLRREIGLIISLVLCIALFQASKKLGMTEISTANYEIGIIEVEDVPITKPEYLPPEPPKPAEAIATENEDIPLDEDYLSTDWIDLTQYEIPKPPVIENQKPNRFIPYDTKPEPVGGFRAIVEQLNYPEMARKARIEGKVIVQVQIDESGRVVATEILQSFGNKDCDEAAIKAIKSVKWKPAMQRDNPVKVWISIPVIFRLK